MASVKSQSAQIESPREFANKSDKRNLLRAIRMTLETESTAIRFNTQDHNRRRYTATEALPDYDALKDRARKIKEQSIAQLPELLPALAEALPCRRAHVFLS